MTNRINHKPFIRHNIHNIIHINNHMNIHKEILEFVKGKKVITSSELAKHLKISWNTADKYLLEEVISGDIERIKKEGVNLWMIK